MDASHHQKITASLVRGDSLTHNNERLQDVGFDC